MNLLDRRRRLAMLLGVLVPLAVALLFGVWRVGMARRTAAIDSLVARAAALAAAPPSQPPEGYRLTDYTRSGDDFTAGSGTLDAVVAGQILRADRAVSTRVDGRTVAVAPTYDADRWDIAGAIVVEPVEPLPPRMPVRPLALGLFVLALAAAAADAFARRTSWVSAAAIAAGPLLFAAYLFGIEGVPAGGTRVWVLSAFAMWAVAAAIGLSLAREPHRAREGAAAWAFLAPSLAHLLIFSIGPILFSLWLSFHEWNLIEPHRPFVGLDNYQRLAADGDFWRAVRNTAVYVLFVPIGMIVALVLALFVNRKFPGANLLRAVFFLPYVTSFVAISLVWKWMFEPDYGLLNTALGFIGLPAQPWLSSPASALPSLMLMSIWMYAGYMMVLFLAGLQSIPASLYESAQIDGANAWQRFRRITLPMLRPTILFVLVTMVIFMFQVFTAIYVMTEGGPLHATDVIVYHIYRQAWEYLRMGYASAMAWVLFAIVFAITLVQFRFLGRRTA